MSARRLSSGTPERLGAVPDARGVGFAVFSEHATRIEVCLFSPDGARETERIALPERSGHIWHGHVAGLRPGQLYGLRAHGPQVPAEGQRFNPAKLLIDPWARRLTGPVRWHRAQLGYMPDGRRQDLTFSDEDSAAAMPKCVVEAPLPPAEPGPRRPLGETVIYEAHLKGLTMRMPGVAAPGSFAALAEPAVLDHLERLGITAIELLPVQAFVDDRHLVERGLSNYWGYQPIAFFAPEPRYLGPGGADEVRRAVAACHDRGIEVILDVVYNHSGEGSELGPTLSFRGLDNASYYRLADGGRHHIDDTGCGNTLNLDHPIVLRLAMDSLRHWVEGFGVDGFRFDLATALGRRGNAGFDPNAPFLAAIRQDPVLREVKLIAEPWDLGPGGYQLGAFPHPFCEWNDKFRDGARRFWRGDAGMAADMAARLAGSAVQFDHTGRAATASVNLIAAHDGFTLADLVAHNRKHNEANGEENRDGHNANFSCNHGVEGATRDAAILAARALTRRNLMATLLLAQGVSMILAGDEIGNGQGGNNNAYCQDNATGWIDWEAADLDFFAFTRRMIAFRKAHPILRQRRFLHSQPREVDGLPDLFWWHPSGRAMTDDDWHDPELRALCVELRTASGTPAWDALETALLVVLNAGAALELALPPAPEGRRWRCEIDTAEPSGAARAGAVAPGGALPVAARSVAVLVLDGAA